MIKKLISKLPSTTITINGRPYLTRYYLFFKDCKWGNIYIHHFHSSDQGDELHSHPWRWALSFVFWKGYYEEYRLVDGRVAMRKKLAPSFNFITSRDFHRVDLLDEVNGAWSLFIAGPRTNEWMFWNRHTNEFRSWRTNPEAIP